MERRDVSFGREKVKEERWERRDGGSCVLLWRSLGMSGDLKADDGISILEANKGMSGDLKGDDGISILEANKDAYVPLMDGDILAIQGRNAITCLNSQCLWPHSSDGLVRVPYVLDGVYGEAQKAKVSAAMQEIATMTCVTFVPRLTERDYLNIVSEKGCWSTYGKQGGAQTTSLDAGSCLKQGTIQHELMHNLGLYHEHARKDRDTYINIMWQYVDQGLCRTVLMSPSGTISFTPSTSLPRGASSCIWLIRLPGNQVYLWLSDFNITPSVDCKSNYLRVYDGNSKTSRVILDNTCGQGKGLSLVASGTTVLLEFVYSSPSALNSFHATYSTGTAKASILPQMEPQHLQTTRTGALHHQPAAGQSWRH
ncbi:astacin-like metalloendopeptidase [Pleurodeles waltl]|uniref:astacin-like metalloendopeptidase n=1 Tax=Pleurodeles waltl TaxID=8319 RepID=UPI0037095E59